MSRGSVLIVDDDGIVREFLSDVLSAHGYSVVLAPDRQAGLTALEANKVVAILMDYYMPGMGPSEFLAGLRQRGIETPVYLMSGEKAPALARELGLSKYFEKPVRVDLLLTALGEQAP